MIWSSFSNINFSSVPGKEYSKKEAPIWTRQIADNINLRVKELNMPRYKHVTQVMLAEQLGAGCRYLARCRWDAESDSKVSEIFHLEDLYCVVTVFGIFDY